MREKWGALRSLILWLLASDVSQVVAWFIARGFAGFLEKWFGSWGVSFFEYLTNLSGKRRLHDGRLGSKGLGYTQLRAVNAVLSNVAFVAIYEILTPMTTHNIIKMALASALIMTVAVVFFLRGKENPDPVAKAVGALVAGACIGYVVLNGVAPMVPKFWVLGAYLGAGAFWTAARWVHLKWPRKRFRVVFCLCWLVALGEYLCLAIAAMGHVPAISARGYTDIAQNLFLLIFLLVEKKTNRIDRWGFGLFLFISMVLFVIAR